MGMRNEAVFDFLIKGISLPGASVYLGSAAHSYSLSSRQQRSADDWIRNYKRTLITGFAGTVSMQRMLSALTDDKAVELLMSTLRSNQPRPLYSNEDPNVLVQLAACGAVRVETTAEGVPQALVAAAPIIQQVILFRITTVLQ